MAKQRTMQEKLFAVLKSEKDPASAEKQLRQILNDAAAQTPGIEKAPPEAVKAQVDSQVAMVMSPWFRFFLTYDPAPTLRKVRCPVLAINGEFDLQVDPEQNLPVIREALKAGGNKDFTVKELPGLNHLFQTAKTGSLAEYAQIEETMSPLALKTMGDWIVKHTKPK